MLDERFVLLGGAIQIVGSARYVLNVMRGHTIPHRLTWLLWSIAPIIAFSAELSKGVGLRSLMTLLVGVSPLVILVASLTTRHAGTWRITAFDAVCGALSVVGLILWQATGQGDVAIALSLGADAFAAAPTVRKALRAPQTESYGAYLGGAISAAVTLLTIRRWTFAEAAWPGYIFCVGTLLFVLIRFPALGDRTSTPIPRRFRGGHDLA